MAFNVTDLMIQVLPEENWHAFPGDPPNPCGQCTDVTGDDVDKGDEEPEPQTAYQLAALQEQLRRTLAQQAGA